MANIKIEYGAAVALTISLGGLATSSTLVAGRASTVFDNTSTKYTDLLLSGFITTHASSAPTVNTLIEIWVYGSLSDAPLYPDGITGTDAAVTLTSVNTKTSGLVRAAAILVTAVANIDYHVRPISIASLFGGVLPKYVGAFVTQNTGVGLHATAGNHALTVTPVFATVG